MYRGGVLSQYVHIGYITQALLTYKVSVSELAPLTSYVRKYAPIIMYGLGLVLTRTSEPHKSAKFHGLVLFSL